MGRGRITLKSLENNEGCELLHEQTLGDEEMEKRSSGVNLQIPVKGDVGIEGQDGEETRGVGCWLTEGR
jgi:hypothetical protein